MDTPTPPSDPPKRSLALPAEDGDAPLHELTRDQLSVLLYTALLDEELNELVRKYGITFPGFRIEALSAAEKADAIADEVRMRPRARAAVLEVLRKVYEFPALERVELPAVVAQELGELALEDDAYVRILWRLLADPSKEVRQQARRPLEALVKAYYGLAERDPEEGAGSEGGETPGSRSGSRSEAGAVPGGRGMGPGTPDPALKEAKRALRDAERAKGKVAELKEQLKATRAELAAAQHEAAAHRRAEERMRQQLERAEEKAKASKVRPLKEELEAAKKEAAAMSARASALEEREQRAAGERERLEAELAAAQKALAEREARPAAAPQPSADDDAVEEAPATWALPRFSREFYDSIERWDLRIQRTAFKRAMLLAENHRHPSLRAIPLEGLPGYYRIRIATDVRLIYRRGEKSADREVEILALIDREDLDRYVRQAKTR